MKFIHFISTVLALYKLHSGFAEDIRLDNLDPPEAQQYIEKQDTSLKYAPKIESNVPAVRYLGNEPHNVQEDIYLANQYHGQDGLGSYLYGYSVPDIAKTEKKKAGGDLRGAYNYITGNGEEIKVEYWDDGTGFHQIDNVPKVLPKQIEDTPEVKAARDEHFRIWNEQAERNSKPVQSPYNSQGQYAEGPLSVQGQQQQQHQLQQTQYRQPQQLPSQAQQLVTQYQQQKQNYPNPGQSVHYQGDQGQQTQNINRYQQAGNQPQQGSTRSSASYSASAQQGSAQFSGGLPGGNQLSGGYQASGQLSGGHQGGVQFSKESGQVSGNLQGGGQYSGAGGLQGSNQLSGGYQTSGQLSGGHQGGAQFPRGGSQHSGAGGLQGSNQLSGGYQTSGQVSGTYQGGAQLPRASGQYSGGLQGSSQYSGGQQGRSQYSGSYQAGGQYSGGHDGQYSEGQDEGQYNEKDEGQYNEKDEEQGPPKGFFYSFDYPVGIIVSKDGGAVQKRDVKEIYAVNKANFEKQLQAGRLDARSARSASGYLFI